MIRGIDLRGATAINIITMIGIGPLITIPLVLANLHGSTALYAWIVGAIVALCDGLVYAELGSLFPASGSTYAFVREAFGRERFGRVFSFLFAWQFVVSAPLVIATGYIGFAQYAGYLWKPLAQNLQLQGMVAAALGIVTLVALYRPIRIIGAVGIALAGIAVATLASIVVAALANGSLARAGDADPHAPLGAALLAGLGPSLVIALYDYAGYGQVCTIGDEVRDPARTLPRAVIISVLVVGMLYVATQIGVLAVIPWRELLPAAPNGPTPEIANYVASAVVERVWGAWPARLVTIAVLVTAFASTYGGLLGASRVPYAAALDGVFFRAFARLHPRGRFPTVSLVVLGLIALPACFFSLGDVINALTAGMVLVQSLAQIIALVLLRARGTRAPYRMWLYPLPAIVAFAGWTYIFCNSGTKAIVYGLVSLGIGTIVYVVRARLRADWPFLSRSVRTVACAALAVAACVCAARPVSAVAATPPAALPTWAHARIVERDGGPVFNVDGRPFFLYGAAFFYERLPRDRWSESMRALKAIGINTLDLYVPWNWHELADGAFDFDGHTNPRRDLDEVLRLARSFDFEIVLRPGPVIRNEWRNGGYPAWLLSRPEYGMPLHDLLEGRYPPTATLQNAHSDDAAAEWMRNATHVSYAKRWIERVLRECAPDADRIVAVALDDDQGAYIDNQTYPAPHFTEYLTWLRDVVHEVTGPDELTFINTYQMKVTSSSPVWAMGNWYQSDTYSIGEHDRAQLEFSTGLLHTRPGQPMMASEFQAGWLEQPDDIRPRPADPSNTSLALATMVGAGVRGVVNFPAQDTLDPSGWEAPFGNAFYAWDAALALDGSATPREIPTAAYGALAVSYGSELAASHVEYDAAIAYLGAAIAPERATNEYFANVEAQTIAAQQACRAVALSCALVDPTTATARELARYPVVVLPRPTGFGDADDTDAFRGALAAYRAGGGVTLTDATGPALARAFFAGGRRAAVEGVRDATFAPDPSHHLDGFLTVANYDPVARIVRSANVALANGARRVLPPFTIPPHTGITAVVGVHLAAFGRRAGRTDDAIVFSDCTGPIGTSTPGCTAYVRSAGRDGVLTGDAGIRMTAISASLPTRSSPPAPSPRENAFVPLRSDATLPGVRSPYRSIGAGRSVAYLADVFRDGSQDAVLDNGVVRLVVSPDAGARASVFEDDATGRSVFTTVGAMRDDVAVEPPLSTSDRIAKYTHQFPAGTFNRSYTTTIGEMNGAGSATFSYFAPDVVPKGARFTRTVTLAPGSRAAVLEESAAFDGVTPGDTQRAVSVSSLSVGNGTDMTSRRILVPDARAFTADESIRVLRGHALGFYDVNTGELATIAWRDGDVVTADILERQWSIVVRLTLAREHTARIRFGYETTKDTSEAAARIAEADAAAQGT